MLPVMVNACMPVVRFVGLSVNVSRVPVDIKLNAVESRRTVQVGQVKSMLFPPPKDTEISDASVSAAPPRVKLNTSVNMPGVAGLNESPKVPDAGGVTTGVVVGDKTRAAPLAAVEPNASAAAPTAVNKSFRIPDLPRLLPK
jgi:hypothetical protein